MLGFRFNATLIIFHNLLMLQTHLEALEEEVQEAVMLLKQADLLLATQQRVGGLLKAAAEAAEHLMLAEAAEAEVQPSLADMEILLIVNFS